MLRPAYNKYYPNIWFIGWVPLGIFKWTRHLIFFSWCLWRFGKHRLWVRFFLLLLLTSVYSFDFSQIMVNELTSQPSCSKCCRVQRSVDTNYSGMGFVCEPKFKRNHWWIRRTLNGEQREAANNCWAMILTTVRAAPISNFHLSPLNVHKGPGGR